MISKQSSSFGHVPKAVLIQQLAYCDILLILFDDVASLVARPYTNDIKIDFILFLDLLDCLLSRLFLVLIIACSVLSIVTVILIAVLLNDLTISIHHDKADL